MAQKYEAKQSVREKLVSTELGPCLPSHLGYVPTQPSASLSHHQPPRLSGEHWLRLTAAVLCPARGLLRLYFPPPPSLSPLIFPFIVHVYSPTSRPFSSPHLPSLHNSPSSFIAPPSTQSYRPHSPPPPPTSRQFYSPLPYLHFQSCSSFSTSASLFLLLILHCYLALPTPHLPPPPLPLQSFSFSLFTSCSSSSSSSSSNSSLSQIHIQYIASFVLPYFTNIRLTD
ncbi:hypothetical protein Pcinc_035939 [Petrolisthes cinctipes]|uniref:Uncharacterized protein n=1 Tax=Petrolisthes cinctipes TaxID=88211 RepID=A0AAE1EPQ7_PETCI|nr:hypothetical protein Pcinc_035939 [Petrolisthes cinctipes]